MSDISKTSTPERRIRSITAHLAGGVASPEIEKYRIQRKSNQMPYHTPLSPLRFLLRSAMVYAHKTAVIHGDRTFDYKTLADRILRLANVLVHDCHVKPGDRVAILCENTLASLEAHFAVPAAGAILVPMNIRLSGSEIEYIVGHSGTSVLLVQEDFMPNVPSTVVEKLKGFIQVANTQKTQQNTATACPYEQKLYANDPALLWNDLPLTSNENDVLSINYTSGSTGRPKGVMVSHRGCYMMAISMCIHAKLTSESVYLWGSPHVSLQRLELSMGHGSSTQIMMNKVDIGYIWRSFKQSPRVTHYGATPTIQADICNHKDAAPLEQTVLAFGCGATVSSTHIRNLHALNIYPTHLYGLTEVCGPASITYDPVTLAEYPEEERFILSARQGYGVVAMDEVRVLDKETSKDVIPDGEHIGEVCFSGNCVMLGYYNNPEETAKVLKDGVFWSGDLAVRYPDGAIRIVDRSKDVIISGGENISTLEVEGVILQMDQILECAVVAGPDEKWGEHPHAFIILKEGQSTTEDAVIAHCRKHLAKYKCPSKVVFTESLPKTSTGKVQKFIIREKLWKSYKLRVN